jgi:hypothetical protein
LLCINFKEIVLFFPVFVQTLLWTAYRVVSCLKDKLFNTKKAGIPDHFMSWSPCWWSRQALSILECRTVISSHFKQWYLHVE